MKTIYLGSQSTIKFNALDKALSEVLPKSEYNIVQRNVFSNVSEQPIGEETLRGATNRCAGCMFGCKHTPGEQIYCIGVENGLFVNVQNGVTKMNIDGMIEYDNIEKKYIDKAVIVVRKLGQEIYTETIWESASVPVKDKYIPFDKDNHTWGEYLETMHNSPSIQHTDPHLTVCGFSREDILYDVFKMIVRTVLK